MFAKRTFFSLLLMAFMLLAAAFPMGSAAQAVTAPPDPGVDAALAYLRTQQTADGGINSFGAGADPDGTARALLGLAAAGLPPETLTSAEGKTPLDYLQAQAQAFTHDAEERLFPGRAGLLLAALAVSKAETIALAAELEATYHAAGGAYSTDAAQDWASGAASDLNQAWAIFGLALAGREVPAQATGYLMLAQAQDGSWGSGDPDTTALAVAALLTSGNLAPEDQPIQRALDYFQATQLESSGWRPAWDSDPLNADTTGWAIQAIRLANEDPAWESWSVNGVNPLAALLGLQKEDGSIGGTYANAYSTADALVGLGGAALRGPQPATPSIHRAGLVVQFGSGEVHRICVPFTEDSLTGYELLARSGLAVESAVNPSLGRAVCRIQLDGCESSNCFCAMPDYWSSWQLNGETWGYAVTGVDQSVVQDGAVVGWAWGEGAAPQIASFDKICPASTADSLEVSTMVIPGQTPPLMPVSMFGPTPWVFVILAVLLLALVLIVFLVLRRRK